MIGVLWVFHKPQQFPTKPLSQGRCGRGILAFPAQIVLPARGATGGEIRTFLCLGKKGEKKEKNPKYPPKQAAKGSERFLACPTAPSIPGHTNSPGFVSLGENEGEKEVNPPAQDPWNIPQGFLVPSPTLWLETI